MRGDNAAGLLEIGELQRNRRANDGVLPFVGNKQAANPVLPIVVGAIEKLTGGGGDVGGERLVLPMMRWTARVSAKGDSLSIIDKGASLERRTTL